MPWPPPLRRALARLDPGRAGADTGATAVEVAILLPPFVGLFCAMVEIGFMLFSTSVIEGAASEAARQLRTGSLQAGADAVGQFKTLACQNAFGMMDCTRLYYDVRTFSSFATISVPPPTWDDKDPTKLTNATFTTPPTNTITTVRVLYPWTFLTPGLGYILSGGTGTTRYIQYTIVLKTEPF